MAPLTFVDFEITKADTQADGTVIVRGPATTDDLDSDRQIIDADFAQRKLPEWLKSGGNVRSMHKPDAIGGGMSLEREGNAQVLTAHIIDPTACKLATPHPITGVRVLRAFSVGISGARIVTDVKAPGGRIVDGEFVEVSLVDRPANSSCKVDLVSKMENGDAHFTDILVKNDMMECPECKGTKLKSGMECPNCKGSGEVEKRQMDEVGGERIDRDKLPEGSFAGPHRSFPITNQRSVEAAWHLATTGHGDDPDKIKQRIKELAEEKGLSVPDDDAEKMLSLEMAELFAPELSGEISKKKKGKIPADDKKVTDALSHADQDLDEAQSAQASDNAHHMSGDDEDDMDKSDAPYLLKRLHDHLSAAFSADSLKSAYPTVRSFGDVIDPNYFKEMVVELIGLDMGTGQYAGDMSKAATAYGLAVSLAKCDQDTLESARETLSKAFSEMYPSVHLTPGEISPGQFMRPFIGAGRAQMHTTGKPRLPMTAHTPDASDFGHGYIQDGRAANSPSAGGPNTASTSKLSKLDCTGETVEVDGVTIFKIAHVPSGLVAQGVSEEDAWANLKEANKQRSFYTNAARDEAASVMAGMHDYIVAMHPGICPMASKLDDVGEEATPMDAGSSQVDNRAGETPKDQAGYQKGIELEKFSSEMVQKIVQAEVGKIEERLEAKHEKRKRKLEKRLREAEAQNVELLKMADPEQSRFRGGAGVIPFLPKHDDSEGTAEQAVVEKREKVARLVDTLNTATDQAMKSQAMGRLQSLLTADELAAVLVTKTG